MDTCDDEYEGKQEPQQFKIYDWFPNTRMRHCIAEIKTCSANRYRSGWEYKMLCGHEQLEGRYLWNNGEPYYHTWNSATCNLCLRKAKKLNLPMVDLNTLRTGDIIKVNGKNYLVNNNLKFIVSGDEVTTNGNNSQTI